MFERFTDRARKVVVLAQEEARMLDHNYIGTEHLLLGLVREEDGVASQVLRALGISLDDVRQQVVEMIGRGSAPTDAHIPFTPRAKKVLELSLKEAIELRHSYIGTEHILLGLIREGEGVAAQALQKMGADLNGVRTQVIRVLGGQAEPKHSLGHASTEGPSTMTPRCPRCQSALAEHMKFTTFTITEHKGTGTREVVVSFCDACGTALGSWVA